MASARQSLLSEDILHPPWADAATARIHERAKNAKVTELEMLIINYHAQREYFGKLAYEARLERKHERLSKEPYSLLVYGHKINLRLPSFVAEEKKVYRRSIIGRGIDYGIAMFVQAHGNHEVSTWWEKNITDVPPKLAEALGVVQMTAQDVLALRGMQEVVQTPSTIMEYAALALPYGKVAISGGRNIYRVLRQDGVARAAWTYGSVFLHAKPLFKKYLNPTIDRYIKPRWDAFVQVFSVPEFDPVAQRRAEQMLDLMTVPKKQFMGIAKAAVTIMTAYARR